MSCKILSPKVAADVTIASTEPFTTVACCLLVRETFCCIKEKFLDLDQQSHDIQFLIKKRNIKITSFQYNETS